MALSPIANRLNNRLKRWAQPSGPTIRIASTGKAAIGVADKAKRRTLKGVVALLAAQAIGVSHKVVSSAWAADTSGHVAIGWQKGGSLAVIKVRGELQKNLAAKDIGVTWVEFPTGPQLLEALDVGSIDFGLVGETPPVFAQAAGTSLVYVGNDPPAPHAEGVLVPKGSPIRGIADLKGKRIVLNKGSNVHYLLVRLLEKAGLKYGDVEVVYLAPSDARAAFENGSVDAWVIWDPFTAAAEAEIGARLLADGTGVADNYIFYVATRSYADRNPEVLALLLHEINVQEHWIENNLKASAAIIAPQIGVSEAVAQVALARYSYGVEPVTPDVVRGQQKIADTFYDLKLVPRKIDVASAVWRPAETVAKY